MSNETEVLVVTVRRVVQKRLSGDRVIHWIAEIDTPRMSVTGRSIESAGRALRKKLVERYDWPPDRAAALSLTLRLRGVSLETEIATGVVEQAQQEQRAAETKLAAAQREVIRLLTLGPPSISVRDISALLGIPKSSVQRIAASLGERPAATALREREKEASRGPIPDLDATIPFYENPLAARVAFKVAKREAFLATLYPKRRAAEEALMRGGFFPKKSAILAERKERRGKRGRRRRRR